MGFFLTKNKWSLSFPLCSTKEIKITRNSRRELLTFWCLIFSICDTGFPGGRVVKNPPANAGDSGSIPGSRRSPGEENGTPLQCSWLGNPTDRGDSRADSPQGHTKPDDDWSDEQQQLRHHAYTSQDTLPTAGTCLRTASCLHFSGHPSYCRDTPENSIMPTLLRTPFPTAGTRLRTPSCLHFSGHPSLLQGHAWEQHPKPSDFCIPRAWVFLAHNKHSD